MLKILLRSWMLLTFSFSAASASAASKQLGLGFILGNPTALSGKWYFAKEEAVDLQLAFNSDDYILIYGDYLLHFPGLFGRDNEFTDRLMPYAGVGPLTAIETGDRRGRGRYFDEDDDSFALGVRVPFGAEWMWDRVPLGIGVELVPGIMILPATKGVFQGGLTLRYYL